MAEIPFRPDLSSRLTRPTADALTHPRAPIGFLWDRRIPEGKVTVLAGAGGTGKSSFLVGLAVARACGHQFLGVPTKPGATCFLSAEDNLTDYLRKWDAWKSVYPNLDANKVAENLSIWEFVGEDFRLVATRYGEVTADVGRIDDVAQGINSLNPRPDLIVIETASRFGAGDENANGAAAALVSACERLAAVTNAAILLMTHVGKTAARSATVDAYAPRGASALTDNARSVLVLSDIPKETDGDGAKKAQMRLLGRPLEPGEDFLVLAAGKSNFARRAAHIIVERVETPHGLVLRGIAGGNMAHRSEEDVVQAAKKAAGEVKAQRKATGLRLRTVIATLTHDGAKVTLTALKEKHRALLGLPIREIPTAVEEAITDGYLRMEDSLTKGGGKIIFPNFTNGANPDQVGSSRINGTQIAPLTGSSNPDQGLPFTTETENVIRLGKSSESLGVNPDHAPSSDPGSDPGCDPGSENQKNTRTGRSQITTPDHGKSPNIPPTPDPDLASLFVD